MNSARGPFALPCLIALAVGSAAAAAPGPGAAAPAAASPSASASAPAAEAPDAGTDAGEQTGKLQRLMQLFAQRRHARARFTQSQYLAALQRPLDSTGTLSYEAPDHLEQQVQTPRRELFVLDHGVLTMQIGRHRRSVPLAEYPDLAPLLGSVQALLAGDLDVLQQRFTLQLRGPLAHWQLRLLPRSPPGRAGLRALRIRGVAGQIREVQLEQTNGDHSVMQIEPSP